MNRSALKTFATTARKELLKKVEAKALKIGITEDNIKTAEIESSDAIYIDGRKLSLDERIQRDKLIARISETGFNQVMEEVAYTWFNRFIALRFMEVNDYLPTGVRVLSSTRPNSAEPDMIHEALELDLDMDKEYVYDLKMNNRTEELFKYLIIMHCNDLNRYLPFMFEKINDYTEILYPEGLLAKDSFVRQMTNHELIPEEDWEKVEIIGWLYQYYIAEKKDRVFADLKKNIKITKETLPAATQLFTPNWVVKYLVENSLGRLWLESYPESPLKSDWNYYLEQPNQEETVRKQLEKIRYKNVSPEEITFLDPCCGSGHILVYAFDVLFEMYLEKGYIKHEIPKFILEKNLYGLDVDDRAAQLAAFAVMMKAREKSRRVFDQRIKLNIVSIHESNWLTDEMIQSVSGNDQQLTEILVKLRELFLDGKEYGSLIKAEKMNYEGLQQHLQEFEDKPADLFASVDKEMILESLPPLIEQANILSKKYDIVCTNPPYMGKSGMNSKLATYLNKHHKDTKSDLFASFIEKGFDLAKENGFNSMVTMQSWMFLSSYEKMRAKVLNEKTITTLLHMENMVMGIAFGTAATVFRNEKIKHYKGFYTHIKYEDIEGDIPFDFPVEGNKKGIIPSEYFNKIPGSPIAYWISSKMAEIFDSNPKLEEIFMPKSGMSTSNNDRFLRYWFEIDYLKFGKGLADNNEAMKSGKRWFPYNKGGSFRRWYGNQEYVVDWENDGERIKEAVVNNPNDPNTTHWSRRIYNTEYFFRESITWSKVTSGDLSLRYFPKGFLFDVAGTSIFGEPSDLIYLLGFLNTKISKKMIGFLSPTLNFEVGHIKNLPVKISKDTRIRALVEQNIQISKEDWDAYETSWEFQSHPLLKHKGPSSTIEDSFKAWVEYANSRFDQLKKNEEELNKIFLELYNLEEEITPEVDGKEITVQKADLEKDIKSFISYAAGCMFGRYSLDEDGIAFAGGKFDLSKYKTFPADRDNILPILSGNYYEDDIVSKFIDFVRITFGEERIKENVDFIANALGRKKEETSKETIRRYFLNEFYKDHIQTYKKRPIYWLFTSGKHGAFNCLIYMHRYDKTTLSRIRTDYLHPYQTRLEVERKELIDIIEGDSTVKEVSKAKKELKSLDKKIEELKEYDEKLHHMADMQIEMDLDDGFKVNYAKFQGLVAKI